MVYNVRAINVILRKYLSNLKGLFKKLIQFLEGSWNYQYFGSLAK